MIEKVGHGVREKRNARGGSVAPPNGRRANLWKMDLRLAGAAVLLVSNRVFSLRTGHTHPQQGGTSMTGKISVILVALAVFSLGTSATGTSAQPTAITACGAITAPGSYRLGNNLMGSGPNCLSVSANGVTIDLDGFMIAGFTAINGGDGLTVRNGMISCSSDGIVAGDGLVVDRVTFSRCRELGVFGGNQATVKDSTFFQGTGTDGFAIRLLSGALVTRNVIVGATVGIEIESGTVSENVLSNGVGGLLINSGGAAINNTVQNYSTNGIVTVCPSNVLGNTATGNGINLVLTGDPSTCNVEHNLAP
jgi:hypothetical protein